MITQCEPGHATNSVNNAVFEFGPLPTTIVPCLLDMCAVRLHMLHNVVVVRPKVLYTTDHEHVHLKCVCNAVATAKFAASLLPLYVCNMIFNVRVAISLLQLQVRNAAT